jgi:osmotically-inducible protein OsmY
MDQGTVRTPLLDGDILAEAVRAALRSDPSTAALAIEVEVWDRVVHLRGVVATSSEQRAAEIVAARVNGIGLVANDLQLR